MEQQEFATGTFPILELSMPTTSALQFTYIMLSEDTVSTFLDSSLLSTFRGLIAIASSPQRLS